MANPQTCGKCGQTAELSPASLCANCSGDSLSPADNNQTIVIGEAAVLDDSIRPLSRFGDYELIEEIARGGMGVVYKARQISLNRIVAVKMILHGRFNSPEFVQRFQAEARAAAKLHHPNIVAIYEIGEEDGQHYFSMEYVAGRDLASLVRQQPLPVRRAVELVKAVAEAIHYAHQRGILHRDLKPSNVLIDANGEPRITDFGLAKRVFAAADMDSAGAAASLAADSLTVSGQVLGSPSYMPPEQATGKSKEVDVRSDVYSLGAILYCLVTGRAPFSAETMEATLMQVVHDVPLSPRLLNATVPKDIETICVKCLEKDPARRYASAEELAVDLGRFLDHEPILARAVGAFGKTSRWCVRNPALAIFAATVALLLVVVAVGSTVAAFRINRSRLQAEEEALIARRNAYGADMNIVQDAIDHRRLAYAQELLLSHQPGPGQMDVRGWEWRYLWDSCRSPPPTPLTRHKGNIYGLSVSPDGRWIASIDDTGVLKLWSVAENREVLATKGFGGPALALSTHLFAALDVKGTIRLWSLPDLKVVSSGVMTPGPTNLLHFHPDGRRLITYGGAKRRVWDAASGRLISEQSVRAEPVVALSHDGGTLAVSSGRRGISVWREGDVEQRVIQTGHVFAGHSLCLALSSDGTLLAAGVSLAVGADYRIEIWDIPGSRQITNFPAHADNLTAIHFSPDGASIVSTSFDRTVEVRDTNTWRLLALLKAPDHSLSTPILLPGSRLLLTGGRDGSVNAWNLDMADRRRRKIRLDEDLTSQIVSESLGAVAADSSALAALRTNGTGLLIDARAGKVRSELRLPFSDAQKIALGPAGKLLAVARASGPVSIWNTTDSRTVAELNSSSTGVVQELSFSADERWLAGITRRHHLVIWPMENPVQPLSWSERVTSVVTTQFWPDGSQIACGHRSGKISVWNMFTGEQVAEFLGHEGQLNRIAVSADGTRLASTSYDTTVRVWDFHARKELVRFQGSRSSFFRVSFSPDGSRLAVNEWGDTLLFDLEARRQVARLTSFTPFFLDADTMLGLSGDEIWHWKPSPLAAIDALKVRAAR